MTKIGKNVLAYAIIVGLALFFVLGNPPAPAFPTMQAIWVYTYTPTTALDTAIANGANTIILKYSKGLENIGNDFSLIQPFLNYCKEKNIKCVLSINYVHAPFAGEQEKGIYFSDINGVLQESVFVPPTSRAYWNFISEKIKSIILVDSNSRLDGLLLDLEVYGAPKEVDTYYTLESGYDGNTFQEFVITKSLLQLNPPVAIANWKDRRTWLQTNNLLEEYKDFVRQKTQENAFLFEQNLQAAKPGFWVGVYPSPEWVSSKNNYRYPLILDLLKGWESGLPVLLFATETYYGGGTSSLPTEISKTGNYFKYTRKDTGETINMYYLSGFTLRSYTPQELQKDLYETTIATNGYWLFSIHSLVRNCNEYVAGAYLAGPGYRPKIRCDANAFYDATNPGCCINQLNTSDGYWLANCCPYFADGVQSYWDTIKAVNNKVGD